MVNTTAWTRGSSQRRTTITSDVSRPGQMKDWTVFVTLLLAGEWSDGTASRDLGPMALSLPRIRMAARGVQHLLRGRQLTWRPQTRALGMVPIVIQNAGRGERAFDIFSRLLQERVVCLMGPIDDQVSRRACLFSGSGRAVVAWIPSSA